MEKKEIKISLSTFFLILAIIVIIIMGYAIFKLYNEKKIANNSIQELKSKTNNLEEILAEEKSSNNIQNQIETLDTNNDIVKQLYGYILKSDDLGYSFAWQNGFEPASFYRNTKTTYSSLSDMEKMLTVLKNYKESEIKKVNKTQLKTIIDTTYIHDTVKVYENINKKAMEIFKQNNTNWNNYDGCASKLEYANDCYYLSEIEGGGKGTSIKTYSEIQKVEKDQESIYIYDKFIYVDYTNFDTTSGDSKIHIYTSADKTEELGTETSLTTTKELFEKYENKLKTYKHTFKKAENGSYYWLSSEI